MFDKKSGKVAARKAYDLIVYEQLMVMDDNFLLKVWHFNIPQKLKCFIWLTCNLKINTWDILCKRGWCGPNRCSLYKSEVETVEHLFVGCPFVEKMILGLKRLFDVHLHLSAPSLLENLISWV